MTSISHTVYLFWSAQMVWIDLTQKLKAKSHSLANLLTSVLDLHKPNIFFSVPMVCSTYLDPRFQCLLFNDPEAMNCCVVQKIARTFRGKTRR